MSYEVGQRRFLASLDRDTGDDAEIAALERELGGTAAQAADTQQNSYDSEIKALEEQVAKAAEEVPPSMEEQAAIGAKGVQTPAGEPEVNANTPPIPAGPTEEIDAPVKGMAKGAAVGLMKGAENMWNFLNVLDDIGASGFGKSLNMAGSQGVIGPTKFASDIPLEDDPVTQGAAKIAEYGAPFAMGGIFTGAVMRSAPAMTKFIGGVATNATIAGVAMDPNQERFTDIIVKKYPWMRSIGADFLASDENDSEATKRLKNAGEAIAMDLGFGALMASGLGVSRWVRRTIRGEQMGEAGLHTGALPTPDGQELLENSVLAKQTEDYTRKVEKALPNADDVTVVLKPTEPAPTVFQSTPGVEGAPAVEAISPESADAVAAQVVREQNPKLNLQTITGSTSELTKDAASEVVARMVDKIHAARSGTVGWDEMTAQGLEYMRTRPEEFASLLKNHTPGTPHTREQFAAVQLFTQSTMQDYLELAAESAALRGKSPADMLPEELALLSRTQEQSDLLETVIPVFMGTVELPAQQLNFLRQELPGMAKAKKSLQQVQEHLRLAGGTEDVMQRSQQVRQAIELQGRMAPVSLAGMVGKLGGDIPKALSEIALSGMISAPRTGARAAIGGMIFNATRELQKANLALFGPIMGLNMQEWEAARKVMYARAVSMRTSGLEAIAAAHETVMTGKAPISAFNFAPPSWSDPVERATELAKGGFLSKNWFFTMADSARRGMLKTSGTLADYGTRLIRGADSLNAAYARRQSYIEDATLEAFYEGTEDSATLAYARTLYPSKGMVEKADRLAREAAYNADYDQLLGGTSVGNWASGKLEKIDGAIGAMPFGKVLIPFMKTSVNDMVQVMETTPLLGMIAPRHMAAFKEGGTARAEALAKMAVGLEVVGGMSALMAWGGLETTGSEPENFEMARALRQRDPGWQPYSVKIGDKWVSYDALGTVGKLMGAISDVRELSQHVGTDEAVRWGHSLAAMTKEYFTPKQIMEDLPELIGDLYKISQDGKEADVASFLSKHAVKALPLSGASRQMRQLVDPLARETRDAEDPWNTLSNAVKNITPGWSRELPPMRNMFGEIVKNPQYLGSDVISPFMVSAADTDPISAELQRLGLWNTKFAEPPAGQVPLNISMPERSIAITIPTNLGGGRVSMKLSPFEYDLYVRFSAGINVPVEAFNAQNADFTDMDPRTYQKFLLERTEKGTIPTLRQALEQLMRDRESILASSGRDETDPMNERDNVMRLAITQVIDSYRSLGRLAMTANLKKAAITKKGLLDRANALGAPIDQDEELQPEGP